MDALIERSGVKGTAIQEYLDTHYPSLRAQHPALQERSSRRKEKIPDVYNWPGTREKALAGMAMCAAIAARTQDPHLRNFAAEPSGGDPHSLFQALEQTDYWTFSRQLGLSHDTRKRIEIENNLSAFYVWPKRDVQFVYITHPKKLLARVPNATAIVGFFTIAASEMGDVSVRHAEAFHLQAGGRLESRSHWESKYVGINESGFVIHCRVAYKRRDDGREYEGLISLKRSRDSLVIGKHDAAAESIQAYRGEFGTLGETDLPDAGHIYCEELRQPLDTDALAAMFKRFYESWLARLHLTP